MANISLFNKTSVKRKHKVEKTNVWQLLKSAAPFVLVTFLVLGSAFELVYWESILWLLIN